MTTKKISPALRVLLIIVGLLSVTLGTIGAFVPLLPTTPFLLLASFCFVRSSNRLYTWLINHRFFGRFIRDYVENKTIDPTIMWITLAILWTSILSSVIFLNVIIWIKLGLLTIAIGVTIHLWKMKKRNNKR